MKPLAIDLYCGLGGWAEGFLAEGYYVVGFDIERYKYPGQLVIQDVLTLHGSQFKDATVIVASPPCTEPSYRAMPWKRAKALNAIGPPHKFIELFEACFRIQQEACQAAGRYIPLIVENVLGAQKWIGQARWHFGSFYLWGDIPALMPIPRSAHKVPGFRFDGSGGSFQSASVKVAGQNWSRFAKTGEVSPHWRMEGLKTQDHLNIRDGHSHTRHLSNPAEHHEGVKGFTPNGIPLGKNPMARKHGSKSPQRKAASAQIAKIPFPLACHIARCFRGEHA